MSRVNGVFLIFALSGSVLNAQISSATLVGTVTDGSGAAIAGAPLEVRNTATQVTRQATTGSNGEYVLQDLSAGDYSLTVRMGGLPNLPRTRLGAAGRAKSAVQRHASGGSSGAGAY